MEIQNEIKRTRSAGETQGYAKQLARQLKPGDILTLSGDLGSGKTTFVQGLAKELGITQKIISPTFIIVRTYGVPTQKLGIKNFYHIDLYRVEDESDLAGLGLEEIFTDKEAVVAIEWPEKLGAMLPSRRIAMSFKYVEEAQRHITLQTYE